MRILIPVRHLHRLAVVLSLALMLSTGVTAAADDANVKSAGGLTAYLGIMPAELIKGPPPHSGQRPIQGRVPKGPHDFHVVIALFDTATSARISDAAVMAKISSVGLAGVEIKLQPMAIADTTTYGAFVKLARDLYSLKVTATRPGAAAVSFNFRYDHRR